MVNMLLWAMQLPVKKDNVIQDVISAIESGQFIPSIHAQSRMVERDINFSDVEEAVYNSKREEGKDELTRDGKAWKYALRGLNENQDKILDWLFFISRIPRCFWLQLLIQMKKQE